MPELEGKVIEAGIRYYLKEHEWDNLSRMVVEALEKKPENIQYQDLSIALRSFINLNSWRNPTTDGLDSFFSKVVEEQPGNVQLHHELALVYTRRAVAQDTNTSKNSRLDYWELALGHWAVTLTSAKYWRLWAKERERIYGNWTISDGVVDQLRKEDIPALLKNYLQEKEETFSPALATRFSFYHALVDQEIYNTKAVRQLIKLADEGDYELPKEIYAWISPTLIRQRNLYHLSADIYQAINTLSPPKSVGLAIKKEYYGAL